MLSHGIFGGGGVSVGNRIRNGLVLGDTGSPIPVVAKHSEQVQVAVRLAKSLNYGFIFG